MAAKKTLTLLLLIFLLTAVSALTSSAHTFSVVKSIQRDVVGNCDGACCDSVVVGKLASGTVMSNYTAYDCDSGLAVTTLHNFFYTCKDHEPYPVGAVFDNYSATNDGGEFGAAYSCEKAVGEPVDVTNGNMYHAFTDFTFDLGVGPTSFVRSYNSRSAESSVLGYGWTHNFNIRLTAANFNITNLKWTKITITAADGKKVYFLKRNSTSQCHPEFWSMTALSYAASSNSYTWTTEDGTKYVFTYNSAANPYRLTSIQQNGDLKKALSLTYNASGQLDYIQYQGQSVAFTYSAGMLSKIEYPKGRFYSYSYVGGDLDKVTYPDSSFEKYAYVGHNLTAATDPNNHASLTWVYDSASDRCTQSSGKKTLNIAYNTSSSTTVTLGTSPTGPTTTYGFTMLDGLGAITSITGAGCSSCGNATFKYRGSPFQRYSTIDRNGNVTCCSDFSVNGYYYPGTITESVGGIGATPRATHYKYLVYNGLQTSLPETTTRDTAIPWASNLTSVTSYAYDTASGAANLIKRYSKGNTRNINGMTKFYNYSTRYSYDTKGRLKTVTDPLGRRTTLGYYTTIQTYNPNSGRLYSVTRGACSTTLGNYSSGKAGRVKDANGVITTLKYDARGRLTKVTTGAAVTGYGRDLFGNLTSVRMPDGGKTFYGYDGKNRLTRVKNGAGDYTTYQYDTAYGTGNLTVEEAKDSSGKLFKHEETSYDSNNRVYKVYNTYTSTTTNTHYTTNGYDNNGNLTSFTDHNNRQASYTYDTLDRLTKVELPAPQSGASKVDTSYKFDTNDNVTSETDADFHVTGGVYDDMGRLVEVATPGRGVMRSEYDAVSNLTKLRDYNGNVTSFKYDDFDRVILKTYADGKYETYTYYPGGQIKTRTNARGVTATYTYNPADYTLQKVAYSDNATPTVEYTYDTPYARVKTVKTTRFNPSATETCTYSYDADGRVQSVTDPWNNVVSYTYDGLGRKKTVQATGGDLITCKYDLLDRLTKVVAGSRVWSYTYDGGSGAVKTVTRPSGGKTTNTLDNLYRPTGVADTTSSGATLGTSAFTLDPLGLKTRETSSAAAPFGISGTQTRTHDSVNQITAITGTPPFECRYDTDGNTTWLSAVNYAGFATGVTLTYDAEDRLSTSAYRDDAGHDYLTNYYYGHDGFLAREKCTISLFGTNSVTEVRYVRDGDLVLQERDGNNAVTRSYVWDPTAPGGVGGLLGLTQGGKNYEYLYDGKGNVRSVIDASNQSVAATYSYDAFGRLASKTGTLDQPYQFSTKPFYTDLGLSYYGYRFYSPTLGRWLTRDPIGETGGVNLYEAMGNDAVNEVDPLGLWAVMDAGTGGSDTYEEGGVTYNSKGVLIGEAGLEEPLLDPIDLIPVGTAGAKAPKVFKACGKILNHNRYLRMGWGKHRGRWVYRISGDLIKKIKKNPHIDLWKGGSL